MASEIPEVGASVGDALLAVHRSYHAAVTPVMTRVHGLAHITGGGLPGNLSRSLPEGCGAVIQSGAWSVPPIFSFLEEAGGVARDEMFQVFNMGVGLVAVVPSDAVADAQAAAGAAGVPTWVVGEVVVGEGVTIH